MKWGENHMIIPTDAEKSFGKTQHLFMIETLDKLQWKDNIIRARCEETTANTILSGESFSSKIRKPLMPTFTSYSHHSTKSSRLNN